MSRATPDSTRVLSGHIMSLQAWQEYGVKENDNIQHPDDACWAVFLTFVKNLALENRLSIGQTLAMDVCVALCGVADVGLSHK